MNTPKYLPDIDAFLAKGPYSLQIGYESDLFSDTDEKHTYLYSHENPYCPLRCWNQRSNERVVAYCNDFGSWGGYTFMITKHEEGWYKMYTTLCSNTGCEKLMKMYFTFEEALRDHKLKKRKTYLW